MNFIELPITLDYNSQNVVGKLKLREDLLPAIDCDLVLSPASDGRSIFQFAIITSKELMGK